MSFCRCIFPRLDSPSCGWIASRVFQTFNARSVGRSFTFQLRVRQWWLWFVSLALTRPSSRPESAKDHGKVAVSSFLSVTNFEVPFNSVCSGTSRLSENKGADIKFVVALPSLPSAVPPYQSKPQTSHMQHPSSYVGLRKSCFLAHYSASKPWAQKSFGHRRYRDSNPTKQLDQYYCEVLFTPVPPKEEFGKIHPSARMSAKFVII